MRITSSGIKDKFWKNKYGKYGKDFIGGVPSLSVPFAIHHPPESTQSYAVMLIDNDSVRTAGHPWIHWLIANLGYENVGENESRSANVFTQGKNSWGFNFYGGMSPHDAPHRYHLHVYALDERLNLPEGFTAPELQDAMRGHVLKRASVSAMYNN